jgi:predicted CoA-binding protein
MPNQLSEEQIAAIYRRTKTIAVVGASTREDKPAHRIPAYLQSQGYRVIPVNPTAATIFGEPTAASLADIVEPVDVVDVFRPSDEAPMIAEQAVALGASVLWLQAGIESAEAAKIADGAGLAVIMNTCMGATHERLSKAGAI